MTDYEMMIGLTELINTVWIIFASYISILFAFLVASYLVASKLAPKIVTVVISLYTLVAVWVLFGINRTTSTIVGLASEIKHSVLESDSSLSWHSVTTIPDSLLAVLPVIITLVVAAAYVGSLFFFFYERKYGSSD